MHLISKPCLFRLFWHSSGPQQGRTFIQRGKACPGVVSNDRRRKKKRDRKGNTSNSNCDPLLLSGSFGPAGGSGSVTHSFSAEHCDREWSGRRIMIKEHIMHLISMPCLFRLFWPSRGPQQARTFIQRGTSCPGVVSHDRGGKKKRDGKGNTSELKLQSFAFFGLAWPSRGPRVCHTFIQRGKW